MLELIKIRKDIAEILQQIKCLFAKGTYATAWSENHTLTTGGPYLKNTIVWYQGFIYKAIHNNESELPTNPVYWECIGEGFLLEEKIPDWWALPGTKTFIKNKPTKTSDFLNDGELGTDPYASEQYVLDRLHQVDVITNTSELINDGADGTHPFITAEDLPTNLVHTIGDEIIEGTKTFNGSHNAVTLAVNIDLIDNHPTGGVPDAIRTTTHGHNGSTTNLVSGVYNTMSGNKNVGYDSINLLSMPDATNSIGFRSIFKDTSTGNFFFKGNRGYSEVFSVDDLGNTTSTSFIKIGGTSNQFLKADGSVDSNIYLTSLTGAELLSHKQNNLSVDGTGVMYPTVDAINLALSSIPIVTNTSSLINDGSNGINPFITSLDLPSLTNLVPYTGATSDVNIGTNNLYTNKLFLFDEAEGESGSIHYADEALHFSNSEDEILLWVEPGVIQLHQTPTIQSNLFTTLLTQTRDHYLPNISGTLALTSDITGINSGTNTGDETFSTIISKLGYTPYNSTNPSGFTSNLGTVTNVVALTLGTTGTDISSTVVNSTTTPVITLNIPTASSSNRGVLSSTDWLTFNNKQNALTNPITGTGTTNYLPKFTGASTLGNSLISDSGVNVGISASSARVKLDINGDLYFGAIASTSGNSGIVYSSGYSSTAQPKFSFNHSGTGNGWGIGSNGNTSFQIGLIATPTTWSATPFVTISNTGNLLLNTTTNDGVNQLQVTGSIKSTSSVTASAYITSGGTSSQFVKGDGSLDSSNYLTSVGIVNLTATGTPSSTTYLRGDNTWATISAGGTGTVTNVSAITIGTTGIDVSSTVANPTTTPVITLNIPTASATNRGALSSTDWSIFNGKQNAITSSALTKVDDTNITLTLGGTPSTSLLQAVSLTLGWTGTLADARITSAATWNAKEPAIASGTTSQYWRGDKTWQTFPTIPTVGTWGALNYPTYVSGTPFVKMTAAGIFALDTNTYLTSVPAQSFASLTGKPTTLLGYGITDAYPLSGNPSGFISTVNGTSITPSSTNGVSATVMAYNDATSSIQTQLNSKQATISLTTTGTSGAATLVGNTLNIPQYSGGGGGGTVTSVSVVTANGFAGSVATNTTTPAITISTTITGLLKGDGTSISAASAGTDYLTSVGISNLTATGTPSSTTYLRGDNTWATVAGGGSPGGSTTQIQYNNAGAFAGASKSAIDANGNITLSVDAAPPTPAIDKLTLYDSKVGGRNMLGIMDSSGLGNILQTHITRNGVAFWSAINASTTLQFINTATLTATGTATAASKAVTNIQTRLRRIEYLVTTAATTAVAGFRGPSLEWWLGNSAGSGGFHYICRFGPATGVATTTNRLFVGMSGTATATAPTDVNPSTLLQMFGIGWDSADTNIQFMNNAALVTATKIDLGASFPVPTVDRTSMYELSMFVAPNSTTITYSFTDLGTGAIATGTVTSNIPAVNTVLAPRGYISAGGTSSVIGIALASLYIETDY